MPERDIAWPGDMCSHDHGVFMNRVFSPLDPYDQSSFYQAVQIELCVGCIFPVDITYRIQCEHGVGSEPVQEFICVHVHIK